MSRLMNTADSATYKKLDFDSNQGISSTPDFIHSTYQVEHKTRNHFTSQKLSFNPPFIAQYLYTFPSPLSPSAIEAF